MEEPPANPESSRLSQIRRILIGDRVEILERRIEILARNLGQEVDTSRAEVLRQLDPLESRLAELESQFSALELKYAGQLVSLRENLEGEFEEALRAERERGVEGQKRFESELQGRIEGLDEQLRGAIATAVNAREELKSRLNRQLDAAQEKHQAELGELKLRLGQQLDAMRAESTDRQELSALFEEFAKRLRGTPGNSRE